MPLLTQRFHNMHYSTDCVFKYINIFSHYEQYCIVFKQHYPNINITLNNTPYGPFSNFSNHISNLNAISESTTQHGSPYTSISINQLRSMFDDNKRKTETIQYQHVAVTKTIEPT